ncbi:MAG: ATP-binding protein [Flavobacteriia bacterium]|nr:ATP-binding protein [Flavobacteriia bacterium]
MIKRTLFNTVIEKFNKGKAIVLLGPRQVGKTTLINTCLADKKFLFLNGDDSEIRDLLEGAGVSKLKAILGDNKTVFIDEAQRIKDVGLIAKMITDQFTSVQLVLSGSSALELNQSTQEPLTGRKYEYHLFPISWEEFEDHVGYVEASSQLEERLVYGMYPDVLNHRSEAREVLKQLTSSYLYKDVLSLTGIKKPELLDKLLKALALQLGSEVSYNELSTLLQIDKATVSKYIDLLEKAFIVFRLNSFSRNQRKEIKNNRKIYFYDNGIRNMSINNLNPVDLRTDKGALWENFLIAERIKLQQYHQLYTNNYFWRTVQKQEIDFVEESNGQLTAYEFKWKSKPSDKIPAAFIREYNASGHMIDKDNFRAFVRNNNE